MVRLPEGKSNLLHLVRWISAVLVVLGHSLMVDRYVFGRASIDNLYGYIASNHHAAVIVFFVLSGYLISYASKKYQNSAAVNPIKSYLADRWSRIYSVLIPGILLTLVVDQVIRYYFPAVYLNPTIFPQDYFEIRVLSNLFSLQGSWGYRMQLGSNSALWSIGYEFSFYILFAVYLYFGREFYRSIAFWVVCFLFLLARGPLIMWYMLIWLTGVLAQNGRHANGSKHGILVVFGLVSVILLFNHFLIRGNLFNLPYFVNDLLFALPVALLFSLEFRNIVPDFLKTFNTSLANFSYTLYVTHLPVLFLSYCLLSLTSFRAQVGVEWMSVLMTIYCIWFAYLFSKISEDKRDAYRAFALKALLLIKERPYAKATK